MIKIGDRAASESAIPASASASKEETTDWNANDGDVIDLKIKLPPGWVATESQGTDFEGEKVNISIKFEDKSNGRSLTVYKNYFGGTPGRELTTREEIAVGGIKVTKKYNQNPSDPSSNVPTGMIFDIDSSGVRYSVLGVWKKEDFQAADYLIDKILTTLKLP
jgi:hypothetical protein